MSYDPTYRRLNACRREFPTRLVAFLFAVLFFAITAIAYLAAANLFQP